MKKIRMFYGLLSILLLIIGMLIYLLFRDTNNIILFSWIPKPKIIQIMPIQIEQSILSYFLKYNLPDMLWFLSGILFLRFLWFCNIKIQKLYVLSFYFIGFGFEISQLSRKIPGTFDFFDLFFMGLGAFIENRIYTKRRWV